MAEYIKNDGVYCKGCNKLLVRYEDGIGYATPAYNEMEIVFDDGSKHITPMCVDCVKSASLDLDSIYQDDVERWNKELKQHKMKPVDKKIANRKAVKAAKHVHKEERTDKMKNRHRGSLRR